MQSITSFHQSLVLVALTFVFLPACGGPSGDASQDESALAPAPPATAPFVPVLESLEHGDVACYVTLRYADGPKDMLADFAICDMEEAIGSKVSIRTESQSVMAASCQGDPECTDSETVELIVDLRVVE